MHNARPDGERNEAQVLLRIVRGKYKEHAQRCIDGDDHLKILGLPRIPGPARRPKYRERIHAEDKHCSEYSECELQVPEAIGFVHWCTSRWLEDTGSVPQVAGMRPNSRRIAAARARRTTC